MVLISEENYISLWQEGIWFTKTNASNPLNFSLEFTFNSKRVLFLFMMLFITGNSYVFAQDPVLPPTNLGMANVYDGVAGKPGWVYQSYAQVFSTKNLRDSYGNALAPGLEINSLLSMHQLIYLSKVKVFGGNLAFTVLVPLIKLSATDPGGHTPSVNPGVMGDLTQGTAVQWSDRKLFGKPFFHRAEFDITVPLGSHESNYIINASSHMFTFAAYHAFTIMLTKEISVSARNQFNYNSRIIGEKAKAGAFYNGNYSIDYSLLPNLKVEAVGYYLKQFANDSFAGNTDYYTTEYGIGNTREQVFGYGPGLAFFTNGGVLMEAKVFFEAGAKNRVEGTRGILRIAIPLTE